MRSIRLGVTAMLLAAVVLLPRPAAAQHPVMTSTRVNLRADSLRTSPVRHLLAAKVQLGWDGRTADGAGMFHVVTVDEPADSGWIAGEYLLEAPAMGAGHHAGGAVTCGLLRWPVKTMCDADAGDVDPAPKQASISTLRALHKPNARPQKET